MPLTSCHADISTGSELEIGLCGRCRVKPLPPVGRGWGGGFWQRLAPERRAVCMPPHKKTPNFSPPFQHRATLLRPSVPNGWPELTEFWPAEGGEFWRAGTVPAGRKLGDREHPGKNLPEPETAGPREHRRRRQDAGPDKARSRLDGIEAGSRSGKGGFGWRFSRTRRAARDCVDLSPGRKSICARKVHLSLTGGARVTCAKPLLNPPRACRPRPTSPDRIRTSLLPPDRRRCLRARGFAAGGGGAGRSPSFRHPRPPSRGSIP